MIRIITSLIANGSLELEDIVQIFVLIFIVVCCTPVHESAHAWAADRLGDPTGRLKGRINLNPLVHMDLIGTIMILLFGFGYAKPVPVNIANFPVKKRKRDFALVALAGPASNLLMALIFSLLRGAVALAVAKTASESTVLTVAGYFFMYASYINCALAVFNLIPVPPLDGSRLVTAVLPDRIYYKLMGLERYSMWIIFGALFLFNRLGFSPISALSSLVANLIGWIGMLPFRPFL